MDFAHLKQLDKRPAADMLVLPYWKDKSGVQLATSLKEKWPSLVGDVIALGDFKGQEGEISFFYVEGQPEKRFCLLGLGPKEKVSLESLRRSYGGLTKSCLSKQFRNLNLLLPEPEHMNDEDLLRGIAEGLLLPNYVFKRHKHRDPEEMEETLLQKITWIGPQSAVLEVAKKISIICEAVYYTRDLINENADVVTPQYLAQCAKDIAHQHSSMTATIFGKKEIEEQKMDLLLAVNRGSAHDPAFIILEYQGNPRSQDKTVLVGKGVTYDTGGLNLKPTGGMETMKCDMSGGAVCLGTILAACQLKLKVNLTIVIPSTENGIDAKSFKPGDVYSSYLGKTVEMTNSDAEGRLILADALAYAIKNLHPSRLIDIATLTGAIEIALGSEASGMMCTDDELAQTLLQAGDTTFERLWRMPLFDEYKERLKSDIADLKSWNGRSAGACVAATFLHQFVEESIPWAHLDIAGTAYVSEAKKYLPKFATGYGVRLMIEFLENLAEQKEKKSRDRKSS
jgi:leucyl aminopeptidase